MDRTLVQGSVTSARDARRRGIRVSNKRWGEAAGDIAASKSSRPSKVDDQECVDAVGKVIMESSYETADVVQIRNPVSQAVEVVYKRCRAMTWHAMFMASALLSSLKNWPTFTKLRKKYYGHLRKGQRRTDVCDHCNLFEQQVL